jgi:hypothetical protein
MITEDNFSVQKVVCVWNRFYIIWFAILDSRLYLYWNIISYLKKRSTTGINPHSEKI